MKHVLTDRLRGAGGTVLRPGQRVMDREICDPLNPHEFRDIDAIWARKSENSGSKSDIGSWQETVDLQREVIYRELSGPKTPQSQEEHRSSYSSGVRVKQNIHVLTVAQN